MPCQANGFGTAPLLLAYRLLRLRDSFGMTVCMLSGGVRSRTRERRASRETVADEHSPCSRPSRIKPLGAAERLLTLNA